MKRSKIIFLLSLCCLLLAGCSENTPQAVAKAYCKAVFNSDFKKAKSLCTPETEEALDLVAGLTKKEELERMKAAEKEFYIVDYTLDEKEGTAKVMIKVTLKEKGAEKPEVMDQKIELKKVDGKWKVVLKLK